MGESAGIAQTPSAITQDIQSEDGGQRGEGSDGCELAGRKGGDTPHERIDLAAEISELTLIQPITDLLLTTIEIRHPHSEPPVAQD